MKTKNSTLKQQLSKDMKKQGHVSKRKPSNKTLSSEKELAETPKKGQYREPSSKKLSGEASLQKSHKLNHIKEFNKFEINEEFFGGANGVCNINIDGDGEIKNLVISEIKKALRNIGGEVHLSIDGKEVDARGHQSFDYWK